MFTMVGADFTLILSADDDQRREQQRVFFPRHTADQGGLCAACRRPAPCAMRRGVQACLDADAPGGGNRGGPDRGGPAVSPEDLDLWAAARTVSMHLTGGTCASCPPKGSCPLYGWASALLRRWERDHGPFIERAPPGRTSHTRRTEPRGNRPR